MAWGWAMLSGIELISPGRLHGIKTCSVQVVHNGKRLQKRITQAIQLDYLLSFIGIEFGEKIGVLDPYTPPVEQFFRILILLSLFGMVCFKLHNLQISDKIRKAFLLNHQDGNTYFVNFTAVGVRV